MRKKLGCPITMGEYERVVKNLEVHKKLNNEQKEWLDYFMDKYDYNFRTIVLKIEDDVLWVITNTKNSVRQFEE